MSIVFTDENTGRRITITSCNAKGTMSAGPQDLGLDPHNLPATAYMPNNKTCIITFYHENY